MKQLVAITVLSLLVFRSVAGARCFIQTPAAALAEAKTVFIGKVISVNDPALQPDNLLPTVLDLERPVKVRFVIERVYKGRKMREIEVGTRTGGLEWGYDFKVGKRYLVYAQDARAEQTLVVKGCGRSRPVHEAAADLKLLMGRYNPRSRKASKM